MVNTVGRLGRGYETQRRRSPSDTPLGGWVGVGGGVRIVSRRGLVVGSGWWWMNEIGDVRDDIVIGVFV